MNTPNERLTDEREAELDSRVAAIYDRRAAFTAYLAAFLNDAALANGWHGGDVTQHGLSGDLLLTAYLRRTAPRGPLAFDRSVSRDDVRHHLDAVEARLYPGAGSRANAEVEKAYLFRPRWHIEKTAARELVKALGLPSPSHRPLPLP